MSVEWKAAYVHQSLTPLHMFIIELAVLDETRQHIELVAKKYRIDIRLLWRALVSLILQPNKCAFLPCTPVGLLLHEFLRKESTQSIPPTGRDWKLKPSRIYWIYWFTAKTPQLSTGGFCCSLSSRHTHFPPPKKKTFCLSQLLCQATSTSTWWPQVGSGLNSL